jgi:CRP-like cAMP-binding protein
VESVADALGRCFLFAGSSAGERTVLASLAHRRRYPRGQTVFREGDPCTGLYVVEEGRVKVRVTSSEGRERILALLGPGDVLGELAVLDGEPRCADVVAHEECTLIFLGREEFREFLGRHPEASARLLHLLARRLRRADLQLHDAAFYDVRGRLASALLRLASEHGEHGEGGVLCPRLSQTEVAHLIGATRESVNKWLRRFQRMGLLRRWGGRWLLLDPDRLRREAY